MSPTDTLQADGRIEGHASPLADRGRIRDLDVIRGGALIGVMWMNVFAITIWLVPSSTRDV